MRATNKCDSSRPGTCRRILIYGRPLSDPKVPVPDMDRSRENVELDYFFVEKQRYIFFLKFPHFVLVRGSAAARLDRPRQEPQPPYNIELW